MELFCSKMPTYDPVRMTILGLDAVRSLMLVHLLVCRRVFW